MKISIFLMFIGIGIVSASSGYSQSTVLTLKVHNKALKDVFREIESKSEYIIFYNDEAVNVNKRVNLSIEKGTISQILDKILDKTSGYKIEDRQVIIYKDNAPNVAASTALANVKDADQAKITVNGKVTDNEGEPLPGVSVTEKGTTNGVLTDIDGNYSIAVKDQNAVLVFSYVGHDPAEEKVGSRRTINAILISKSSELDEVIVVGYGTQRKSSITGSIASINIDKMKDITTPSVANMLQGKVAGVVVTPTSGQPGAGVSIRVRGTGSIRGLQEPLWVIDGVVGNAVADLNPNDIEAISILKDGSATALYGSRGANGVILVTTKRGASGMSQIDASLKLGISQLQRGNLKILNGAEHYEYAKTAYENQGVAAPSWFQPYLATQNFDWWDFATQNALTQNYNLAYRYGNDKIRSYISGDYYNEEGAIKGFKLDRFTLRVNTDYIINKRLTLKAKLATSYRETDNKEHTLNYTGYLPWDSPYDSKGNIKKGSEGQPSASDAPTADPRNYWYSDTKSNYLYDRVLNWSKSRNNAMDLGLGFDYKIFDFLTFESNNKVGFGNNYSNSYTDPFSMAGTSKKGTVGFYNSESRVVYTSQMLRFLKTIADKHEFNAFLGYDYDERRAWTADVTNSNIFPGSETLSGGAAGATAKGTKAEEKNAALFFNGNYAYDNKYLFQVSARNDGSSRFGSDKRWAPFWSVGGGWNMHEEEFIKNLGFINALKPRISYGTTGNLPAGAYEWITKFDTTSEYGGEVAFRPDYAGNKKLAWEETRSFDAGLDFRLFNRVSVTLDYYSKRVKNLIYLKHLSAVTGFNRQTANDGNLKNTGYEITITPEIIKTKDIYWDVTFNLGYNQNKITYLPDGNDLYVQAIAVGYPHLNWYMKEWAGVDSMTGSPLWFKVDEKTGEKTATNDYSSATSVLLNSSPTPKYNGGISTSFAWKGLSLNASFTFAAGAKIYNGTRAGILDRDGALPGQPAMKLADGWTRWEKPGDIATHPKLIPGSTNSSQQSSRYLESGDYFKVKSLSLAYSLPKKWLTNLGVKSMSVSVGGENLFTITKFSGLDPEIMLSSKFNGNTSASGIQTYPTTRRFTMGLNLKF